MVLPLRVFPKKPEVYFKQGWTASQPHCRGYFLGVWFLANLVRGKRDKHYARLPLFCHFPKALSVCKRKSSLQICVLFTFKGKHMNPQPQGKGLGFVDYFLCVCARAINPPTFKSPGQRKKVHYILLLLISNFVFGDGCLYDCQTGPKWPRTMSCFRGQSVFPSRTVVIESSCAMNVK